MRTKHKEHKMNTTYKLILRKSKSHITPLIGLILLMAVGVCFFVTLFTIAIRYEEVTEQYLIDHGYAHVTLYGFFDEHHIHALREQQGVLLAKGRVVRDFREDETVFRGVSLTEGINIPHVYLGRLPVTSYEGAILRRNARALNLSIGDVITLGEKEITITGFVASPEYLYLVQNNRTPMAQPHRFGVIYVTREFFPEGYNEIVVLTHSTFDSDEALEKTGGFRAILQQDQINHYLYRSDLGEIRSFAYIFPLVFALLIAVVITVMLKRILQKEKRQIGTLKALGASDGKIIKIYLVPFLLAALIGGTLGCIAAMSVTDFIIHVFSGMFEVPTLGFIIYPSLWIIAILVSALLSIISALIGLTSILTLSPSTAMGPRKPTSAKRIFLERIGFLWGRFSFNTRYSIKNSLRNKGRFWAMVLGICGSCALLVFSMGFYDSVSHTKNMYFNHFANYDVIVEFDPLPLHLTHPASSEMEASQKALMLPARIRGESFMLAITENGFNMVHLPTDALQSGVIIPEYFAKQWEVDVGDVLEINDFKVNISAVVPQFLGLTLYTSFDYVETVTNQVPPVYNTLFGRGENIDELTAHLKEHHIDFVTIDDDKTSFYNIMESIGVLIWFLIACSVALGFIVLYSIGLINLSAREHEYMFLGIMGYSHKSIMKTHIKETLLQLALGLPLGFVLGNLLLESIRDEFSGSSFVIAPAIFLESYLLATVLVILVILLIGWFTSWQVKRLDIVAGLKAQGE